MWLMQRAGKIAFIISVQGHEVAQVGITWPLRKGRDWMAPFYRSIAAAMTFGMTPEDIITAHLAKGDDISSGGRQMPGHYGAAPHNILSVSSPVGTQVLHAVGLALGAWVRGDDAVAITQFGEGTANQGEVHEAMNFAGVHKLPVIFVCENNGYAISVPLEKRWGLGGDRAAATASWRDGGRRRPLACAAVGGARAGAARRRPAWSRRGGAHTSHSNDDHAVIATRRGRGLNSRTRSHLPTACAAGLLTMSSTRSSGRCQGRDQRVAGARRGATRPRSRHRAPLGLRGRRRLMAELNILERCRRHG
jgi:hypothetical protein